RSRLFGGKLVRDRPARAARYEAKSGLPVEAVELVDHTVDVVVELAALELDLAVEAEHFFDRMAHFPQRTGLEAAIGDPFEHAGLRIGSKRAHLAPAVTEEMQRPRCGDRGILLAQ